MLALLLSRRETRSTHGWEIAKREDAEQTGLAASAIADDDEFPEPSPSMSAVQSSSGSPNRRSAAELPRGGEAMPGYPTGTTKGAYLRMTFAGLFAMVPDLRVPGSGFWVLGPGLWALGSGLGRGRVWGRACGGSGDGLLSAPRTARKSPPLLLVGRRSSLVVSRGFAVFGSFKWALGGRDQLPGRGAGGNGRRSSGLTAGLSDLVGCRAAHASCGVLEILRGTTG